MRRIIATAVATVTAITSVRTIIVISRGVVWRRTTSVSTLATTFAHLLVVAQIPIQSQPSAVERIVLVLIKSLFSVSSVFKFNEGVTLALSCASEANSKNQICRTGSSTRLNLNTY